MASLPSDVFSAIETGLTTVELSIRTVLYQPQDEVDWVYFPQSGMISVFHVPDDNKGRGIEVATVGREGVVGAMAGLGLYMSIAQAVVQLPLRVSKIPAPHFRKLADKYFQLRDLAVRFNEVLLAQAQVTAACNALHVAEQRFCRWLLQTGDRAEQDKFVITQNFCPKCSACGAPPSQTSQRSSKPPVKFDIGEEP